MKFTLSRQTPGEILGYGTIPAELRGVIKGASNGSKASNRIGGDMTNEEYAKEHGISRRQASKKRRGY